MSRKTSSPKIDEAVSRSVDFELTVASMARRSERRAWWVAGGATLVSLTLLGGYFFMLPLKEKVPYLVMADAYTGTSTVARLTDDVALQRVTSSEAINRSNVAHFVLARESYDLALTNLRDWTTVLTMASPDVASGYTGLYAALTTVRRENVTRGRELSRSESHERRALMLPQELKAMGPDKEVFLCEGLSHPVMCNKIRYYEDGYFKARLMPCVAVPALKIHT